MNEVLKEQIGKTLLVYIDDVTIFTRGFHEHLQILRWVFKRLREERLYLKPKKCTFATHQMSFLGFIVDKEGLRTDLAKIEAIINFPRPTNRTELRGVLGFAMFYRRFVKNFSSIVAPLNELLRKNRSMEWTDKQEQAFIMLKENLTTSPVVRELQRHHHISTLPNPI